MARYDKLRKLDRNKAVVEYWQAHPEASLAEIGEVFEITPQRVSQLLKNAAAGQK